MEFKQSLFWTICVCAFSVSSLSHANPSYVPPERINCMMNENFELLCAGFDRTLFKEDVTNADWQPKQQEVFHFTSAVAYFTPDHKESTIFFTYRNYNLNMVKLKSTLNNLKPNLTRGNWRKFNEEIYTCDASYMSCAILND